LLTFEKKISHLWPSSVVWADSSDFLMAFFLKGLK
jgi:hypothetical protein